MTALTKDQVRHIAKLARLRLTEGEVEKFTTELTKILQYIDILQEVDTADVLTTAQVTGLANVLREDVLRESAAAPDALLSCSPLPVTDRQIVSPSAHG